MIGVLAERGILQPLACLKCPNCASTNRVTPAELGAPVRCELCSASVSFGSYVANSPKRPAAWAMRVMPALDEAHFSETIPVMAALSVVHAACGKDFTGTGMTYLVGAELVTSAMKCEIDFMILIQDAELPAIIISEAKSGNPDRPAPNALLSSDDLAHLEAVQDSFRALGIDCWICFATTRPALEASEIDLLRRQPSSASQTLYVYQPTQFVIWGGNPPIPSGQRANLVVGDSYEFWGADWSKQVLGGSYTGGASFKGYADQVDWVNGQWTTRPGGSSKPPATVASYIGVIAATDIVGDGGSGAGNGPHPAQHPGDEQGAGRNGRGGGGAAIQGNIAEVVVIDVTDPAAYRPDPGHRGTGVFVAVVH